MLDARQRCRVDAGLKLALHQHRVPHVDHEADADEQQGHADRDDAEDLAALVRSRESPIVNSSAEAVTEGVPRAH